DDTSLLKAAIARASCTYIFSHLNSQYRASMLSSCGATPPSSASNEQQQSSPSSEHSSNHHRHYQAHQQNPLILPVPGGTSETAPGGPGEHIVMVHVGVGETFSVRAGNQIQNVCGPATVRMVSNSGPPLPMPMQVPPGHLVQQIVDENGILTHVILAPQPDAATGFYGPSGILQSPPTAAQPAGPPSGAVTTVQQAHIPVPYPLAYAHPITAHAGSPICLCSVNGGLAGENGTLAASPANSDNLDGPALRTTDAATAAPRSLDAALIELGITAEELADILSEMPQPTVTDSELNSCLVHLYPPERVPDSLFPMLSFELQLSETGSKGFYNCVFKGPAEEISLQDLKPNTEYFVKAKANLDALAGRFTESVAFRTRCLPPGPPGAPVLVARSRNSLTVKWGASENRGIKPTGYALELAEAAAASEADCEPDADAASSAPSGSEKFTERYRGSQRQFKINKLSPSRKYLIRVAAFSSLGLGDYSQIVAMATAGSAPTQPEPPYAVERSSRSILLAWSRRPADQEFELQCEDPASGLGFLAVYSGNSDRHRVANLRRATEYRFRLQARGSDGAASKWSPVAAFCTPADPPGPPVGLQKISTVEKTGGGKRRGGGGRGGGGSSISQEPGSIGLAWDSPVDDGGSTVKRYLVLVDGRIVAETDAAEQRQLVLTGLQPGRRHALTVVAASSSGQSVPSETLLAASAPGPPGQPLAPPRLSGRPRPTQLCLAWTAPPMPPDVVRTGDDSVEFELRLTPIVAGGVDYLVDEEVDGEEKNSTADIVYRGPALECSISDLEPGRRYAARVRARNSVGPGRWSPALEAATAAAPPDAPTPPAVSVRGPHSAGLAWRPPVSNNGALVVEYRVEIKRLDCGAEFSLLYSGPALSCEAKGLLPASEYAFRVLAVNAAGPGAYSAEVSAATPPGPPEQVGHLRIVGTTSTSITAAWTASDCRGAGVLGYSICVNDQPPIEVSPDQCEYTISSLRPDTLYRIRVRAYNSIGPGPMSPVCKAVTGPLPPPPPNRLECAHRAADWLKLRWSSAAASSSSSSASAASAAAASSSSDWPQYQVEAALDGAEPSWQLVYHGPALAARVARLTEQTAYLFRIRAANSSGFGDYSEPVRFVTDRAVPPAPKPPRVSGLTETSCRIDWQLQQQLDEPVTYLLQLMASGEPDYTLVHRGTEQCHRLSSLRPGTDYHVRVAACRRCPDTGDELTGPYSHSAAFCTRRPAAAAASASSASKEASTMQQKQSQQKQQPQQQQQQSLPWWHWQSVTAGFSQETRAALACMLAFGLLAALVAALLQRLAVLDV
ncbi:hypothetical protein BOX15_Mlig033339g1, partial [Macrostomum lignano]